MMLLQTISVIFGLFMLYVVRIHRTKKNIEVYESWAWAVIWAGFIFLSIFPQTVQGIAQQMNIARVFDLFVIMAFMFLVYATFQNIIAWKRLERKLEDVIRKHAIDEKVKKNSR